MFFECNKASNKPGQQVIICDEITRQDEPYRFSLNLWLSSCLDFFGRHCVSTISLLRRYKSTCRPISYNSQT